MSSLPSIVSIRRIEWQEAVLQVYEKLPPSQRLSARHSKQPEREWFARPPFPWHLKILCEQKIHRLDQTGNEPVNLEHRIVAEPAPVVFGYTDVLVNRLQKVSHGTVSLSKQLTEAPAKAQDGQRV